MNAIGNMDKTTNAIATPDFRKVAQSTLSLSELMAGREKLDTKDIVNKDLTIANFDLATMETEEGDSSTFAVVQFAEFPDKYYNGGTILTKLVTAWANLFNVDVDEAAASFLETGGVKVRFKEGKTRRNRDVITIEVL